MHRRSFRTSVVAAAAVCVLALVTVPAASAAEFVVPKVSIVPVDGTDLPATTTTVPVSVTITPATGQDSIPTPYYYVLVVADFGDFTADPTAAALKWTDQVTGSVPSLTISDEVSVAQGHEYEVMVAVCDSQTTFTGCLPMPAVSYFTVGFSAEPTFNDPEIYDPSGDYWCSTKWLPQWVDVTFTGTLQAFQTYSLEFSSGPYRQVIDYYTVGTQPEPAASLELSGTFPCDTVGDYSLEVFQGETLLDTISVHAVVPPEFVWPMPDPSPNPFSPSAKRMSQTLQIATGGHLILRIRTDAPDTPGDWQVVYERDYGKVKSGKTVTVTWNGIPTGAKKPVYGNYWWCVVLTNDHYVADGNNWQFSVVPNEG